MSRVTIFIYGVVSYLLFVGTFFYIAGFMGNIGVPKSIDSAPEMPLASALAIDLALIVIFGLQHSVMARPGFKRVWTKVVPKAAERSTYVLFSCIALGLLFWQWQPLGGVIWEVRDPMAKGVLWTLFGSGWLIVFVTSFFINHFDLFGLRQVWLNLIGKEYTELKIGSPGLYKFIRHPLYVGWFIGFWATPTMTVAHALCAAGMTAYMLIAIKYEEKDLLDAHGEPYAEYRRQTPMFIPIGKGTSTAVAAREMS
jgi:protein-S-isoprenylcysteine O-methyltransferase Ste14